MFDLITIHGSHQLKRSNGQLNYWTFVIQQGRQVMYWEAGISCYIVD